MQFVPLSRRALERLGYRALEPRARPRSRASAVDASAPDPSQESRQGVIGLRVNDAEAQDVAPPGLVVADRGHNGRRGHAPLPPGGLCNVLEPRQRRHLDGDVSDRRICYAIIHVAVTAFL